MANAIHRRDFLVGSGAVALAMSSSRFNTELKAECSFAGDPPARNSSKRSPRLFAGLCAFSFGPLFKSGQMSFESFFERAVELRADAVDITGYYLKSTEPAYLYHLRNVAFRSCLPFTGVACAATLLPTASGRTSETLAELRKWVDVADALGASNLRVFSGKQMVGISEAQTQDGVVEMLKRIADYASGKGVVLGVENQRGPAQSADRCMEIMGRVNSPFAGITLDITHFVPTPTQDNYAQITACIPAATQTHIRSGNFDDGSPIDLERIWKIFAASGYRGYMSVEYESQTRTEAQINSDVPQLMEETRRLCRTYSA